jgi:uncharacterized membrane protein
VISGDKADCPSPAGMEGFICTVVEVRLESGPDKGETFSFDYSGVPGSRMPTRGDELFLARSEEAGGGPTYHFADYRRDPGLLILAVIFVVVVIALSRWQGVTSLIGLALSLLVLIRFVLPAILAGESPVLVAIVGAAAVMFVTLYLAHGINARTTTAILGTLASLALTGIVAVMFVSISKLTGFASEEALFLQFSAQQVNLQGLLLGGVIIGTLGVLDDVTVTQASAVWELRIANPSYRVGELYRSAIRIGRDHTASTVNTLVLAYAGASLPLLILFSISDRPLTSVANAEMVASEIVRTLVGSIGLVASVPITTALTAAVVVSGGRPSHSPRKAKKRPTEETEEEERGDERGEWDDFAVPDRGFWESR